MLTPRAHSGLVILCLMVGCNGDLAAVRGVVSLNGMPVSGGQQISGTVRFYPEDGSGAPAVGRIDATGEYAVRTGGRDGIRPGAYLVAIAVKRINPPDTPGGMPRADLVTPRRYASVTKSGLREVVGPGKNTINFDLSSN